METDHSITHEKVSAEILFVEDTIQFYFHGDVKLSRAWSQALRDYGLELQEEFCSPCG